uniref:Uncharacterized protein n=1 Tax=Tanacetum cinerariifolium TaxID=118510 RepID=A0A699IB67_TANCI|nr:hypothetical protein [Tanacetum cinerariifolium]
MGHGSGYGSTHGSAHGSVLIHDNEDDSPVEEVLSVKPKKPLRRATRVKKDEPKEPLKDWTVAEESALCQAWVRPRIGAFCAIINNIEANHESASGGLNLNEEVDEDVEKTQEFWPMGRDRAKAKKKAVGSSRGDILQSLIW